MRRVGWSQRRSHNQPASDSLDLRAAPHTNTSTCLTHPRVCGAGNAIATGGEDGQVKVWSRAGMLRSTLMAADDPVYCLAWGGSAGSQLLVCSGSSVSIRSLQGAASGPAAAGAAGPNIMAVPRGSSNNASAGSSSASTSNTQLSWKAHDGVVLKADWNAITGNIVTGGEDCKYKVTRGK